jgi:ketosteroid isomerase-like protein
MTSHVRSVGMLALLALGSTPARASNESEAQAVVTAWVGDFNRGDLKSFVARCVPRAAVLDGFPPYAWTGCADWMSAYASNSKAIRLTDGKLSIGRAVSAFSEGDRAYLVYPATFSDKEDGKPVVYNGTWTITLQKVAKGWAVTGSGSNWGGNYTVRSEP